MSRIKNLIRPDLQHFVPYRSARDEKNQGKIFLNANESPWEYCSMPEAVQLNRYPQKQPGELLAELAQLYNVQASQLVMLRGSDEPIDLLTRLFCTAGQDAIMICPPTFGMYAISAQLQGVNVIEAPMRKSHHYQIDFTELLNKWTPQVKIIFLCSPNNPTGNVINPNDILELCQRLEGKSIVVVDEAYIEFSDQISMSAYLTNHENLAILRTFSKAYGLAAARCGFLLANSELCDWIKRIAPPYPLSAFVMHAVMHLLSPQRLAEVKFQIQQLKDERQLLFDACSKNPHIKKVWPSTANFLLLEVNNADDMMDYCDKNGFVLRHMHHKPELENCIRVTIGLPEENKLLMEVLEKYK